MVKSLKSKFSLIYTILVLIIAIVGITSVFSMFKINKSINRLMTDNYKSIKAVTNMMDVVENQNNIFKNYVHLGYTEEVKSFYDNSAKFYQWYNIEDSNITEQGEKELVRKLLPSYVDLCKKFSELQEIRTKSGSDAALKFYNTEVIPIYNFLKNHLKELSSLNETAMFQSKDLVSLQARNFMYIIICLSLVSVIGAFILSVFLVNKFLKPIYALTETVKSLKEGDLNQQFPITSDDEVGTLAKEFNKMTKRLIEFEKSTKGKLLLEKNRSITIVKSISDPLIVLNTDNKIVLMNTACENFFNVNEEDAIDRYFLEVVRNGDLYDHIINVVQNKSKNNSKIIYLNSNDKDYYFNIIVNPIRNNDSIVNGVIVLFQNVTQLKSVEKMKQNFISTISHEFKTPLTSIMIGASLMDNDAIGLLNESQKKILNTIKEDGERLSELVTNLLQLSKIESDNAIFDIKPCHLLGVIDTCVKNFSEIAQNKQVNLYYDVDENLPKVNMDQEKITWVINNLISNALKFTNAGDEIYIYTSILNDKVCVYTKDTGIGIPDEYLDKIFDRFIQVKDCNSESRGTGLGLSIAKEIVEAHGGDIWCESSLDTGSTFIFTLPLA